MIETYLVTLRYDIRGAVSEVVDETEIGMSETDVIDRIIQGDYRGELRNIYRVALDEPTRDVTDAIAEIVWKYSLTKSISAEAEQWLDWCGYDVQRAAE